MAAQQPSHQAYTVIKREGQDDYWLNIGAAFMHQDGDGFNVMLQALTLNGKIVLRPPKTQTEEPAQPPAKDNNKRLISTSRREGFVFSCLPALMHFFKLIKDQTSALVEPLLCYLY